MLMVRIFDHTCVELKEKIGLNADKDVRRYTDAYMSLFAINLSPLRVA